MNLETCCCGNVLRRDAPCRVYQKVCHCDQPGPGPRALKLRWDLPKQVTAEVHEERRRLGLPIMTESEKAAFRARGD